MDRFLLTSVFVALAGMASAGEIACDVTFTGESISPVKTIFFAGSGTVGVAIDPTQLILNHGQSVTVTNENGVVVCRVEEKQ